MASDTTPETWASRAPSSLTDPLCPSDHPVAESVDRRWLWRMEGFLAVSGTSEAQHAMRRDLASYLIETCTHHWHEAEDDPDYAPAHRQCLWCNYVEWVSDGE